MDAEQEGKGLQERGRGEGARGFQDLWPVRARAGREGPGVDGASWRPYEKSRWCVRRWTRG